MNHYSLGFYWENRDLLHLVGILLYYLLYIYATNRVRRSVFYFIKFTEEDGVWLVNKKKSLELLPE